MVQNGHKEEEQDRHQHRHNNMRKSAAKVRIVPKDTIYPHELVTKLINRVMYDGKRRVAAKQVYRAFELVAKNTGEDALKVYLQAIENVKPNMEVRPRRIGGAAYQVPTPVRGSRKESLAIRWIVGAANALPNAQYKTFGDKLATEIMNTYKGEGGALAKKQDIERQAEANRAFAHFKW